MLPSLKLSVFTPFAAFDATLILGRRPSNPPRPADPEPKASVGWRDTRSRCCRFGILDRPLAFTQDVLKVLVSKRFAGLVLRRS